MREFLSSEFKELLLSHHPDFPCFQNDVIILFNRRICAGCLLAYPTAFLVILIIQPYGPISIVISLIFALLSQLRRVINNNRIFGHYCRFLAGIAFGFGLGGFVWAVRVGQWFMAAMLVTSAVIYFISRAYSMKLKLMEC
jgi:hypothetical protein